MGEPRWPMAIAVVATGLLRAALPHQLRNGDAAWLFLVLVVGLLASASPVESPGIAAGCTT